MHAGNLPSHEFKRDPSSEPEFRGYTADGWYFWDETEGDVVGPYGTFELAEEARRNYTP